MCTISNPLVNSNWIYSPETLNSGRNWWYVIPCDLEIWWMTLENNRAPLLCYFKLCAAFRSHWCIQTGVSPETPNLGQIPRFLELWDLEIWRMTLQNNRAPLLCYFKLCASFCTHWWIQTWVTVQKHPIWVKINDFFCRVTFKLDRWPWKTIDRAPFLCYFKICASFRTHWWIQTGVIVRKCPIWVKINDFFSRVTFKLDRWPWTRQIWGIWKLRPAYSPEKPNLGQNQWRFVPCDLEIWWMTLENNRASLLCCFNLCATFHSHWWIQTGVTVRKRPIWVKIDDFF